MSGTGGAEPGGGAGTAAPAGGPGARLAPFFGIDPRGLAALRIGLGAMLIVDLSMRCSRFRALYTDAGVFPRSLLDPWLREWILPLHNLSGSFWWQASLLLLALLFAGWLALGFHTRLACVASWLLCTSLQVRNPLVLNFGDDILRMALFWAMFLPLDLRWSIDQRRGRVRGDRDAPVCSLATAAFLLQIAFVYFFTAMLKRGPDWHRDGTAIYYMLQVDGWVTSFGMWLREHERLLPWLTRATLMLEYFGPITLFAPIWWLRSLTVLAFLSLHLGIAASYRLGVFPWVDLVVLLPFLPPRVWAAFARLLPVSPGASPSTPAIASRSPALARARDAGIAVVLAYVLAYNVESVRPIGLPGWLATAGHWLRVNQQWLMFTPSGPRFDGWYVMPGTMADGRQIDLSAHGPELTWRKPARISEADEPFRWTQYLWQMPHPGTNHALRRHWAEWTCRTWNSSHPPGEQLVEVEMHFVHEETLPPGRGVRVDPRFLIRFHCATKAILEPGPPKASRKVEQRDDPDA
jgi:hypothetical protein